MVINDGPASVTGVVLTDDLPANVKFLAATSAAGTCALQSGDVVCELDTVASGDSVDVKVRVRPRKVGTIKNVVTVTAAETDPVPGNNTDTESTKVVA
jgi:hypothetical protein